MIPTAPTPKLIRRALLLHTLKAGAHHVIALVAFVLPYILQAVLNRPGWLGAVGSSSGVAVAWILGHAHVRAATISAASGATPNIVEHMLRDLAHPTSGGLGALLGDLLGGGQPPPVYTPPASPPGPTSPGPVPPPATPPIAPDVPGPTNG